MVEAAGRGGMRKRKGGDKGEREWNMAGGEWDVRGGMEAYLEFFSLFPTSLRLTPYI